MLLMAKRGIRGEICHATHRYAKANNKSMKDYKKDEEESFLEYLAANNMVGQCQNQHLLMVLIGWKICLK